MNYFPVFFEFKKLFHYRDSTWQDQKNILIANSEYDFSQLLLTVAYKGTKLFILGFIELRSNPLQATPGHSNPLQATPG